MTSAVNLPFATIGIKSLQRHVDVSPLLMSSTNFQMNPAIL